MDYDYVSKEDSIYFARRHIITLYKECLVLLEDLKKDHEINFEKLKAIFPDDLDVLDVADFMGMQKYAHLRKRILDHGNDALRNFEADISKVV
jgi:hypothetical protein